MRRNGGQFDDVCPEKESELDLQMMFVLGTSLFIALWLGVALGVVLCEPMLRQKSMREARRRYRAQIAALRAQIAVHQAAGEFRAEAAYATAMLPAIDAKECDGTL